MFKTLSVDNKLELAEKILDFMKLVEEKEYCAIDFYDSSIIYEFSTNKFTMCDIDLFRKKPVYNDMGEAFWGTKRMKSPEEYILGANIDSRTDVFKIGALFMNLFGEFTNEQMSKMYKKSEFIPVDPHTFSLGERLYRVVWKAVSKKTNERYQTVAELHTVWKSISHNFNQN